MLEIGATLESQNKDPLMSPVNFDIFRNSATFQIFQKKAAVIFLFVSSFAEEKRWLTGLMKMLACPSKAELTSDNEPLFRAIQLPIISLCKHGVSGAIYTHVVVLAEFHWFKSCCTHPSPLSSRILDLPKDCYSFSFFLIQPSPGHQNSSLHCFLFGAKERDQQTIFTERTLCTCLRHSSCEKDFFIFPTFLCCFFSLLDIQEGPNEKPLTASTCCYWFCFKLFGCDGWLATPASALAGNTC